MLWSGFGTAAHRFNDFSAWYYEWLTRLGAGGEVDESAVVLGRGTAGVHTLTSYWNGVTLADLSRVEGSVFGTPFGWAMEEEVPTPVSVVGSWAANALAPASAGLTAGDLLDGMELICEAGRIGSLPCDLSNPPRIETVYDLPRARSYLECVANTIERRTALGVVSNVPSSVVDAVQQYASSGTYPEVGGEYGAQSAELAGALIDLQGASGELAVHVRGLSNDIRQVENRLQILGLSAERADFQLMGTISSQMGACAGSVASITSSYGIGTIATCASALSNIHIADELNRLSGEELGFEEEALMDNFVASFEDRSVSLSQTATRLTAAQRRLDAALARLESNRMAGRRALGRAVLADMGPMDEHYALNTALRRRYNTSVVRYREALLRARRLAFLARRALEQRLAVNLEDLDRDLGLVAPPATWVNDVCTMDGIDYTAIRSSDPSRPEHYADAFIGDYVRRLELVVEGYRLSYPFQDTSDTTVISLRDEILRTRQMCTVDSPNLLARGGELAATTGETLGIEMWGAFECAPLEESITRECIVVTALEEGCEADGSCLNAAPFLPYDSEQSQVRGFRVRFGHEGPWRDSSLTPATRLAHAVTLPAGRYQLSWYGRSTGTGRRHLDPSSIVDVVSSLGAESLVTVGTGVAGPEPASGGWSRYWLFFDVPMVVDASGELQDQSVWVAVRHTRRRRRNFAQTVDLAAFQVERTEGRVPPSLSDAGLYPPSGFWQSRDDGTWQARLCEDTNGVEFRQRWRRQCMRLCRDGFAETCESDEGTPYCYWETEFRISQSDIESGRVIRPGGFAIGNYNYRIDSLVLNFVGTGVRECSEDHSPSTCYAAGYVPYTLEHLGPFPVRNHEGADYPAPLFDGRIEHGRGLAVERYVTNPVTSADRALLADFTHLEFRGRPITGNYRLRVWDQPGVRFERIEDMQLILGYRYWTRFE